MHLVRGGMLGAKTWLYKNKVGADNNLFLSTSSYFLVNLLRDRQIDGS